MRRPRSSRTASVVLLLTGLVAPASMAVAQEPHIGQFPQAVPGPQIRRLQLEVFINDHPTGLIGAFEQLPDGSLAATPEEVKGLGVKPMAGAIGTDGLVHLGRLRGVTYRIDEAHQSLYVTAADDALEPHVIDASPTATDGDRAPEASYGGVLNYTLFASTDGEFLDDVDSFHGLSGAVDARLFSPYGTFSQSAMATTASAELVGLTRLQTTWSYSDPERLVTYRAGDTISGSLSWTRPVWLGGLQIQRNFALRPDLVTMPVPAISGSAAVPSTLDVYTHNVKTFTAEVPAGPYEVTNLPIASGAGAVSVVLHDALGRELVTTLPFYASNELLKPGFSDYSAEMGFARRYYGVQSYNYDGRLMAWGTMRYGLADWLTLEGHAEGGEGLLNGGAGAVFSVGAFGIASLAFAGSDADGGTGTQVSGSLELGYRGLSLYTRTQRTFGDYKDIACVTAGNPETVDRAFAGVLPFSPCPPRALNQVSLGMPLPFDPATLNLSYTEIDSALGDRDRIVGFSYTRPFFRSSTLFASAFKDLDEANGFSIYAGISVPLGERVSASGGLETGPNGARFAASASKSEQQEVGSYGWRVRESEGAVADRSAAVSYRAPFGRVEVGVQQYDDTVQGTAQFDGSVVFIDGGLFLSNRIDDAFAVVDVGVPGVAVQYENRPVGETGKTGKLLVPYLKSYQPNKISIDPANLPVDATVPKVRDVVIPADRSGVVVGFGVSETAQAALITFVDAMGKPLEVGAQGHLEHGDQTFVIGYDGQTYLQGLSGHNAVMIERPDGATCKAEFDYAAQPGEQVTIRDVVCR